MSPLHPPPVPQRLREMLKDYPGHIERLQEVLNYMLEKPAPGVGPFDRAVWLLEGRLETFIQEARDEFKAAEASGDAPGTERAKEKLDLMFRARSSNGGIADLSELWDYLQVNKRAFE